MQRAAGLAALTRRLTQTLASVGVVLAVLSAACDTPRVTTDPELDPTLDAQLRQTLPRFGVVPIGAIPAQNPALVELGHALMFDKILSGNRDISCATCHSPLTHGADGLSLAIGTGGLGTGAQRILGPGRTFVPRNAPSLLNQGLRPFYLLWDGRVSGLGAGPFNHPAGILLPPVPNILAAQAMLPVLDRREMRGEAGDVDVFGQTNELAQLADSQYVQVWQAIMQRLLAIPEYVDLFHAAFPSLLPAGLRFEHATSAIAAFAMQAFAQYDSPFDRYLGGNDGALSTAAKRGALLFFGQARCAGCHNGPLLGGEGFANVGVPQLGPGTGDAAPLDLGVGGRQDTLALGPLVADFNFRIPPLRNVELTAPYFHDGAYPTLDAVVRHYSDIRTALANYDVTQVAPALRGMYHGGAVVSRILATLAPQLSVPLELTNDQQADLVAFLESLTDPAARDLGGLIPARVPSGLTVQ